MKNIDWIKLALSCGLVVLLIVSPFLPGPSNVYVIGFSALTQSLGFFGLPLVPIGIAWIWLEWVKVHNGSLTTTHRVLTNIFAGSCAFFIMAIYTLGVTGLVMEKLFGFIGTYIIVGLLAGWWLIGSVRKMEKRFAGRFNQASLYPVVIPLIALVTRLMLLDPLSDETRTQAIESSEPLIHAIENYRTTTGHYPHSLDDLVGKYVDEIPDPPVMGITAFRYNQIGDKYSLSFSQWLEIGSLEELVLYDKDNLRNNLTGKYGAYDYSLDLCRIKGAFASSDAGVANWRYYHLD